MKLNMPIIFVILIFLFSLIFQSCEPHFVISKTDPAYVGDYKLIINREYIPDTMFQLVHYTIPFMQGSDRFPRVTLSANIIPFVDTTFFFQEERDSVIIYCKKGPGQFADPFSIDGITENLRIFSHVDTVSIINPFSILHSDPAYLHPCSLSLSWDKTLSFDRTFLATWHYQGKVCTLSIFDPLIATIDSLALIVSVSIHDTSGNTCDLMQKNINATVQKPVLSCPPEIKIPMGEVLIPLQFISDIPVTDLFYRIDNADPPFNKKVTNPTNDTIKVTINEPMAKVFQIWLTNAVSESNICTTNVITYRPDTANPSIRLVDTTISNQILQHNAYECEVIVKDDIGIKETYFLAESLKIPAVQKSDSLWSGNITNIPLKQIYPIKGMVIDSFGKLDSVEFTLYYDPTSPPIITYIAGPPNGSRVSVPTDTMTFSVNDSDGIDSVFYLLNDIFVSNVDEVEIGKYSFVYKLGQYGLNNIKLVAIDSLQNTADKTITFNFNTIPNPVSVVFPADGQNDIETINGVNLIWNHSIDADGDAISYQVFYGTAPQSLLNQVTIDSIFIIDTIPGGSQYFWYIKVLTELDTIRCPEALVTYFSFNTINHPAEIQNFEDKRCSINDLLSFSVTAIDLEGIQEYQWDFNSDGTIDKTTPDGKVEFQSAASSGLFNAFLHVIDLKGSITKDTAIITVTNTPPVISTLPDTLNLNHKEKVDIDITVTDDGDNVLYEWDFGQGYIVVTDGDTTINAPEYDLPLTKTIRLRVTDNDQNVSTDSILFDVKFILTKYHLPVNWQDDFYHRALIFNENFYIYDPLPDNNQPDKCKILTSQDAINWTIINDSYPLPMNTNSMFTVSDGQLYYIPSHGLEEKILWNSNNATSWNQLCTIQGADTILFSNSILLENEEYLFTAGSFQDQGVFRFDKTNYTFTKTNNIRGYNFLSGKYNDTTWVVGGPYLNELFILAPNGDSLTKILTIQNPLFELREGDLLVTDNYIWAFTDQYIFKSSDRGKEWKIVNNNDYQFNMDAPEFFDIFQKNGNIYIFDNSKLWIFSGNFN